MTDASNLQVSAAAAAAAEWVILREDGDLTAAQERAFATWLGSDEDNLAAYESALWALDAAARHADAPALEEFRRQALSARRPRRHLWLWAGAPSVAASLIVGGFLLVQQDAKQAAPLGPALVQAAGYSAHYVTQVGERTAVTLPDGSVATLDTNSEMRVAYTPGERGIRLLRGQAFFDVAHGKPRPFNVYANGQRISAVGTVFNVRLMNERVRVAMIEGVVRLREVRAAATLASDPIKEVTITAGEAATLDGDEASVQRIDPQQVSSWTAGLLTFDDETLANAVAEFNRYSAEPIVIADRTIGAYRISGVFKANEQDNFTRAMADILPVTVTAGANGAPVLRARGKASN